MATTKQLVDPLGRNIGGIPNPTITNVITPQNITSTKTATKTPAKTKTNTAVATAPEQIGVTDLGGMGGSGLQNGPIIRNAPVNPIIAAIQAARNKGLPPINATSQPMLGDATKITQGGPTIVNGVVQEGNPTLGDATKIVKNSDGTTTTTVNGRTTTAPSYSSSAPTVTTTPPISTTAGTGGTAATGFGYETYYNEAKLKGEIPIDFEEWKKKNTPKTQEPVGTVEMGGDVKADGTGTGLNGKSLSPAERAAKQKKNEPVVPVDAINVDEAFKTLMAGGKLDDTRNNAIYKANYGQFSLYNNLDSKTLGNMIADGEVGPKFTDLLARFNPTKYAEVMKIANDTTIVNDINTNAENLYNTVTETPKTPVVKTSEQMMQSLIDGIEKVPQKYSDIVAKAYADNPEIKEKGDKIAVLDDKIDTLDTEIDKMAETYRTKYPDVPQAMLMGMVNRAAYGLTQERNALVKESKLLYSQYKDEKDMIDKGIEYDIAQQDKLDTRKFELQKILYGDKKEEEIDLRELAQAEDVLNDSRQYDEKTKKEARLQLYQDAITKLGLEPIKGADLDTLMNQFAGGMKEATTYERGMAAKEFALKSKEQKNYKPVAEWEDDNGVKHTIYADENGNTIGDKEYSDLGGTSNLTPDTVNTALAECRDTGTCGQGVNDYIQKVTGKYGPFGDLYTDKQKLITPGAGPEVGSIAIWNPSVDTSGKKWGHVAVVLGDNGDGTIKVHDWNWDNKGNQKTHDVDKASITGTGGGYYIPQGTQKENQTDATKEEFITQLLGQNTFTKENATNLKKAIRQGKNETAVQVIKKQAKASLTPESKNKLESNEVAKKSLLKLGSELAQFYKDGGKTSYISGNFENVINKLGEVKDPKLVTLATEIGKTIQVYRNAISGTAYSAQEGQDINKVFPGISKSEELNNAIIKGSTTMFDSVIDSYYETALGDTGYAALKQLEGTDKKEESPEVIQGYINEALKTMDKKAVAKKFSELYPNLDISTFTFSK